MGSQRVRHNEVTKYACTLEDHCSQRGIYIYAYYFGVGTVQVIWLKYFWPRNFLHKYHGVKHPTVLKPLTSGWDLTPTKTHGLPTEKTHLVSRPNEAQVLMSHHRKNSVRDKVTDKKWIYLKRNTLYRLSGWHSGKEFAFKAGDAGSIPGSGRSPGGGHGNPLQYSWLQNSMNRGAWWATVHGIAKEWDTT